MLTACMPKLVLCVQIVNVNFSDLSTIVIKPVIIITIIMIIAHNDTENIYN